MRESVAGLLAAGFTKVACREYLNEMVPEVETQLWGRMIFTDSSGGTHGLKVEDDQYQPGDGNWEYYVNEAGDVEKCRLKMDAQDHFNPRPKKITEDNVRFWMRKP